MFSDNTDLFDRNIKKDVEDKLWMENYIEEYIKGQYDFFMKGFCEKLSERMDKNKRDNSENKS